MPILCLDVQEISGAAAAILRPKGNNRRYRSHYTNDSKRKRQIGLEFLTASLDYFSSPFQSIPTFLLCVFEPVLVKLYVTGNQTLSP